MSAIVIPKYCNVSGCVNLAVLHSHDCQNHPVNVCSHEHMAVMLANRARIYAEGERLAQYWRENWQKYAFMSKFG